MIKHLTWEQERATAVVLMSLLIGTIFGAGGRWDWVIFCAVLGSIGVAVFVIEQFCKNKGNRINEIALPASASQAPVQPTLGRTGR